MTSQLHPTEIAQLQQNRISSGVASFTASTLSLALLVSLHWLPTQMLKNTFSALAAVAAVAGVASSQVSRDSYRIHRDVMDASNAQRVNRLFSAFSPAAKAVSAEPEKPTVYTPVELFDFTDLHTKRNKTPHLIYNGQTGSGKTSLCEKVVSELPGIKIACSPHYDPDEDWLGFRVVTHSQIETQFSGDYTAWLKSLSDGDEIVLGAGRDYASVTAAISGLLAVMDERYNDPTWKRLPPIEFSVDEIPALARTSKEAMDDLMTLGMEARKRKIRLHLLLQDDGVKTLNIEGSGGLRDNFNYLRLGEKALEHAKRLVKQDDKLDGLVEWLKSHEYPLMVDDKPAVSPDIALWKSTLNRQKRIDQQLIATESESVLDATVSQVSNTEPTDSGNFYTETSPRYSPRKLGNSNSISIPDSEWSNVSGFPLLENLEQSRYFELLDQAETLLREGKTQTDIIKNYFRMAGRQYQTAVEIVGIARARIEASN